MPDQSSLPKILQILPSLESGGVEQGTVDMARVLDQAGWGSYVLSAGGRMVRNFERTGVKNIVMTAIKSKNPLCILGNTRKLVKIIQREKIDLIHVRSRAPAWSALRAAKKTNTALLTTFHGAYGTKGTLKKYYNSSMLRAPRVIAVSEFIKAHILTHYPSFFRDNKKKIDVVPRGADTDVFDPEKVSQIRVINLIKAWKLRETVPVIMLPGRLTSWKGHETLIYALFRLHQQEPDLGFQCVFVGDGSLSYQKRLEKMIRTHGLEGMVRMVSHCDDMSAAYMASDIVVSASTKPEAFGRVVAEGMLMGRAVIATNHGGASEQIQHEKTGWLFPVDDEVALYEVLRNVLELSAEERQKISWRARAHAEKHYTKDVMCQSVLDIYKDILGIA
ncbi:MAG: glycosyltransferase family 4 protein [Alphaproteobacteria bacterium]